MGELSRAVRWTLAAAFLLFAFACFGLAINLEIGMAAVVTLLAMFLFLIFTAVALLPDTLPIASRPFTAFIDSIYGTGPGKGGRPPFDCGLARGYLEQGRSEEALREYRRMMKLYPREAEPYSGSILILLREFQDRDAAVRMLRRGLRKVRSEEACRTMQIVYREEEARLPEEAPGNDP